MREKKLVDEPLMTDELRAQMRPAKGPGTVPRRAFVVYTTSPGRTDFDDFMERVRRRIIYGEADE